MTLCYGRPSKLTQTFEHYFLYFMDKKTEAQRVWIVTWLVQGGVRVQLQGCWDA